MAIRLLLARAGGRNDRSRSGSHARRGAAKDPAAGALRRIHLCGGFPVSQREREEIGNLLAFQFVRGKWVRQMSDDSVGRIMKMIGDASTDEQIAGVLARQAAREGGVPPSDEDVNGVRWMLDRPEGWRTGLSQNDHVRTMLKVAPDLVPYFERRTWNVLSFAERSLITCDTGMFLAGGGGGVMVADEVVVPIDPSHALVLTHPIHDPYWASGTPEQARMINRAMARAAQDWIFFHPLHDAPADIAGAETFVTARRFTRT